MIRKVKWRFVQLAMLTLTAILFLAISGMNLLYFSSVVSDADFSIDIVLGQGDFADGTIPEYLNAPRNLTRLKEIPHESRYFLITLGDDGAITGCDITHTASVSADEARSYGETVLKKRREKGLIDWYRYRFFDNGSERAIIFYDCGRKFDNFLTGFNFGILMFFASLAVSFLVIFFLSGNILRPVSESYSKQKQFIADAGHEIKTPLAIINANLDLLEMDNGPDESIKDIRQQISHLSSLTSDLILLSRMEEYENSLEKIDFPVSEVITEALKAFRTPAEQKGLALYHEIQPLLTLNGNQKALEQLTYLLLDNAVKYCSEGGVILLKLYKKGKHITLSVSNPCREPLTEDQLNHLFDRFFRADSSRNSETGGHGIGLSMARALVNAHGGNIKAEYNDKQVFTIKAHFPA